MARNESGDIKFPQSNMHTKCFEPKLRKIYNVNYKLHTIQLIKIYCSSQIVHLGNSRLTTIKKNTIGGLVDKCMY